MKIGTLRAYPNGECQFENIREAVTDYNDVDNEVSAVNNRRYLARRIGNEEQLMNERNLENLARAMSSNAQSVNMKSCF